MTKLFFEFLALIWSLTFLSNDWRDTSPLEMWLAGFFGGIMAGIIIDRIILMALRK